MNYGSSQLVAGLNDEGQIKVLSVDANGKLKVSGIGGSSNADTTVYSVDNISLATNSTGTQFSVFTSAACEKIVIANTTSTDIEYRRNSTGVAFPVPANSAKTVIGITNSNQVGIRRIDQSNTQITIYAELVSSDSSTVTTAQNASLFTDSTGANFALFSDIDCTRILIANTTSVDIEYRRNATGVVFPIPANSAKTIIGITNANQIGIRRVDQSNTQITIYAELIS